MLLDEEMIEIRKLVKAQLKENVRTNHITEAVSCVYLLKEIEAYMVQNND